ncbi:hypothetical protein [Streptomyces sp. NBC_01408]|uniref:hypothetical protein n=1 Tax=Streptomyces sp. NBC_01408 TaxID=2903855 RepID=UPI002258204E|nr:hypothetical protein [Streptomyces sp. NBC_01408]MCX4695212.1 beta-lactamase family protein [Streptomyces sp. NBC_01408]
MTLLSEQAEDIRALVGRADPGAAWAVGGPEGTHAGSHPRDSPGNGDAVLDVGGLAAVLALWPVIGSLVEEGTLQLHTPLAAYGDPAASRIPAGTTAHHLLTHSDGAAALTGLAEHLGGGPLHDLAATRVWQPLGMTGTRFEAGTLRAPLADLVRFLRHVVSPAGAIRAWAAESLRIRTGELTPARGLLWHPAPHGVWAHPGPAPGGPALWVCPSRRRWALLLPGGGPATSLRSAFRDAVFRPDPA